MTGNDWRSIAFTAGFHFYALYHIYSGLDAHRTLQRIEQSESPLSGPPLPSAF